MWTSFNDIVDLTAVSTEKRKAHSYGHHSMYELHAAARTDSSEQAELHIVQRKLKLKIG